MLVILRGMMNMDIKESEIVKFLLRKSPCPRSLQRDQGRFLALNGNQVLLLYLYHRAYLGDKQTQDAVLEFGVDVLLQRICSINWPSPLSAPTPCGA